MAKLWLITNETGQRWVPKKIKTTKWGRVLGGGTKSVYVIWGYYYAAGKLIKRAKNQETNQTKPDRTHIEQKSKHLRKFQIWQQFVASEKLLESLLRRVEVGDTL